MATISKLSSGNYQAKVRLHGIAKSKTFRDTKLARQWAKETEHQIEKGLFVCTASSERTTLAQLMLRYQEEVLPLKKSQKSIKTVIRTVLPLLGSIRLIALASSDIAYFRDLRLRQVSHETIRKELLFLRRLVDTAQIDWGYNLPRGNPVKLVRLPSPGKARARRLREDEYTLLDDPVIGPYCILACETGMRRGEIANIKEKDLIYTETAVGLHIPETKSGVPRVIPLTKKAQEAFQKVLKRGLKADSISQAFNRACKNYGIEDLRFHDLRHEATSRLFERGLSAMEVAKITGHRDAKMLFRYTHLHLDSLAQKIS